MKILQISTIAFLGVVSAFADFKVDSLGGFSSFMRYPFDLDVYSSRAVKIGLLDNTYFSFNSKIATWENAKIRYRVRHLNSLILFENGKIAKASFDILITSISFVFIFSEINAFDYIHPYLFLLNGTYERKLSGSTYACFTSALHPFLFTSNNGITYENEIGIVFGNKYRTGLSIFSFANYFEKFTIEYGIKASVGVIN